MSDYIGYCVGREVAERAHKRRVTEGHSPHVDRIFRRPDEYGRFRSITSIARKRTESKGESQ